MGAKLIKESIKSDFNNPQKIPSSSNLGENDTMEIIEEYMPYALQYPHTYLDNAESDEYQTFDIVELDPFGKEYMSIVVAIDFNGLEGFKIYYDTLAFTGTNTRRNGYDDIPLIPKEKMTFELFMKIKDQIENYINKNS